MFNENSEENLIFDEYQLVDEERDFATSVFLAVKNNIQSLNDKLSASLKKGLTINSIYKLDYAILLVAMASVDYLEESISLAINEAVELAKKYSTEKSPSFVNGVLSSIYKNN